MNTNLIFLILFLLIILVLALWLFRYTWTAFMEKTYAPPLWREALGRGEVSPRLKELERSYPDKVRFHMFYIQIRRIIENNIPGDFAELGVYQGATASLIHAMEPSRTLHLFDTFEGFPEQDLSGETGKAATYTTKNFADTSLGQVLKTIDGGEMVKSYPGRFPETVPDNEINYSLVSIDADLYLPTTEGLNYFYPRLSPGGVIIVHDYSPDWPGVGKAVDEFAAKFRLIPLLIPDQDGSVLIIKPQYYEH